jgi:predicted RNase H-like HicB family nuclease
MKYQAIFERSSDGTIWGYCPDNPGATGAGDSLDEAKASLREGVRLWVETATERGIEHLRRAGICLVCGKTRAQSGKTMCAARRPSRSNAAQQTARVLRRDEP